jgi:hypothetical protein
MSQQRAGTVTPAYNGEIAALDGSNTFFRNLLDYGSHAIKESVQGYAEDFGNYNKTYGSLGAAIGFMTWIWLSTIVILIGAELNAEMEHQTLRDTTTGVPKPHGCARSKDGRYGRRGARLASLWRSSDPAELGFAVARMH